MRSSAFSGAAFACLFVATVLPTAASVQGAPDTDAHNATAYRALRVARAALGAEALDHLVEVSGRDGVPQPYVWKIVLKEGASKTKEVEVADGKIVAQHVLARPPETTGLVKLQALNVDSGGAFDAADAQSRKSGVRFDAVNYTLHANDAGEPVWTLELFDQNGAGVGKMRLTATDGTVASIDGRLANAPGRPGEPLTAAVNASPPRSVSTSTTTTETTTVAAAPSAGEPPAVHDVDTVQSPSATGAQESEGGFFTRAGRTLDHTQGSVVHSFDTAQDNVARSLETAHHQVDHSLRATGAKLERFFTGHSDLDKE